MMLCLRGVDWSANMVSFEYTLLPIRSISKPMRSVRRTVAHSPSSTAVLRAILGIFDGARDGCLQLTHVKLGIRAVRRCVRGSVPPNERRTGNCKRHAPCAPCCIDGRVLRGWAEMLHDMPSMTCLLAYLPAEGRLVHVRTYPPAFCLLTYSRACRLLPAY